MASAERETPRRVVDAHVLADRLANAARNNGLTLRECEVLGHIALGRSNRDAASLLLIAENTVKAHVRHVLLKLGARSRAHAVAIVLTRDVDLPRTGHSATAHAAIRSIA